MPPRSDIDPASLASSTTESMTSKVRKIDGGSLSSCARSSSRIHKQTNFLDKPSKTVTVKRRHNNISGKLSYVATKYSKRMNPDEISILLAKPRWKKHAKNLRKRGLVVFVKNNTKICVFDDKGVLQLHIRFSSLEESLRSRLEPTDSVSSDDVANRAANSEQSSGELLCRVDDGSREFRDAVDRGEIRSRESLAGKFLPNNDARNQLCHYVRINAWKDNWTKAA